MSTLLIKRAYRVFMLSMASVLIASMLAPIVAFASTDLVAGDTAVVSNPGGANLRTDTTVLDDSTISADLPEGSTVWIQESPVYTDTGVWVYVAADGYGPGWISTDLLSKVTISEEPVAEEVVTEEVAAETEPATTGLAWLEPIDSGSVVDYNNVLPVDGLAVRDAIDGNIIGYAPVGTWLDVTSDREWAGDVNYVRVNFNGVGGYVHGDYVELSSEAVVAEPTEEVIWVEPTEEIPVETEVVTEEVPVETEVVTEEVPVETEVVTEEAPVETEVVTEEAPVETEVVTEEAPVETEAVTEEAPVETEAVTEEAPVETEVVTEEVPVETEVVTEEVPVETEVVTEEVPVETEVVTEEVPVETEVVTEEVPVETEVVTEEAPVETEVVAEEVPVETEVVTQDNADASLTGESQLVATATEEVVSTPTEAVTETAVVTETPTEVVTETAVVTEAPTEVVAQTEAATDEATTAPTEAATQEATKAPVEPTKVPAEPTVAPTEEAPEPVSIASTTDKFDSTAMIGSATVTGTTSGLLCRVSSDPASPVLMTLSEGTKVLVSDEAVNGYLGIDCGGLQGFADVNYLWSGGAGDAEISAAKMNVVVTGTGNGLNCRTGAGLSNSVITTIYDGTTLVTRGAASNGWTPVVCGGQNGFVSTTWIEAGSGNSSETGSTATKGSATVNTGGDGLYCRSGAGTSYGVVTVLSHGASVSVRGAQQGEWVPVNCGGVAGFAHSAYLSVSAGSGSTTPASGAGTATGNVTVANTGGQGLNCRTGADTSNGVITVLSLGQTVKTRSGSTNGWTAVICGGTNGFISSDFVAGGAASTAPSSPAPSKPAPSAPSGLASGTHVKTTDALNLRYSGNGSSSISTVIPAGKVIKITGAIGNDYYPVNYDGLTGYVHSDYVVKTSDALSQRGGSGNTTQPAPVEKPAPAPSTPSGSAMVNYAMRYVGYPYVWATHGPASFDCSGFTYWVTQNVMGKNIGYGTWTQVSAGTPVSKANLQPGDLVFFQNTYTAGLSHVGLYIGNGQFIHAQNEETGVVISDLNSSYYGPRWYGGVRL